MSLTTKIAIGLLAVAVLVFAHGYYTYAGIDWIAATVPLDVGVEGEYELTFESQLSADYDLELATDRNLGFEEQNLRLGLPVHEPGEAVGCSETLVIDWTVHQGSRLVAEGKSNDSSRGFWGPVIGKVLVDFPTIEGKNYEVTARIVRVDPVLSVTNPRLRVSVCSQEHKNAWVSSAVLIGFSYSIAGLAAVIWVAGLAWRLWCAVRRHRSEQGRS